MKAVREHHRARIERIRAAAAVDDIDCLAFMPGTNLFYLTGVELHLSERPTILFVPVADEAPVWFAPQLELSKLQEHTGLEGIVWSDEEGPGPAMRQLMEEVAPSASNTLRLGCEYRMMRLLEWELLQSTGIEVKRIDITAHMAQLRQKKDETELKAMRKAATTAEEVLELARQALEPGLTERELANMITLELMKHGSSSAFGPSVAFGPNSGRPHSQVGEQVLREGDLAWIDMGAVHDNYCSDITRTFPVGTPDDELQQIYRVVYRAQKEAREKTRPGMTAGEVDSICRDVITATGYGEYFIHRTGHGLGLDVHEEPYIVQTSKLVLEPGMVFTIEPGVYLPGKGGVRIEDDVVVTDKGVESLTSYRRDWLSS